MEIPDLFSIPESHSKAGVPSDLWGRKPKGYALDCFLLLYITRAGFREGLHLWDRSMKQRSDQKKLKRESELQGLLFF